MAEFPALPAPASKDVVPLSIDAFLECMHGPAATGVPDGEDPAEFPPTRFVTVDVRSPSEFALGHIPGAVNIPLFPDDARAEVGTTYTQVGRFEAIQRGLELIGPRFSGLVSALSDRGVRPGDRVLVYCWRGGMRSGSVGWLYSLCGFSVNILEGGYRSYRRWCKKVAGNNDIDPPCPVIVLGGCTGVGKTAVLLELRKRGEQVLDLEALANHRGSAFGAIGQGPQPSNETYENMLALAIRRLNPDKCVWLEHEGDHVGKVFVPFGVNSWVRKAPRGTMVVIEMPREVRVRRLVEDYCSEENLRKSNWVDDLKNCISGGLAKKLGGQNVKDAIRYLDEGKWHEVVEMLLGYYDKLYLRWVSQSLSVSKHSVTCVSQDAAENAVLVAVAVEQFRLAPKDMDKKGGTEIPVQEKSLASPVTDGNQNSTTLAGSCFCGEVKVECWGNARSSSYCHCSICRKLSGSPFSCQALFSAEQVRFSLEPGGSFESLKTSKGVERSRCKSCFAPVKASLFGGKFIAVPLGLIADWKDKSPADADDTSDVESLRPRHHLHYGSRVMDVRDGLPKYVGACAPPDNSGRGPAKRPVLLPEADW